MIDYRPDWDSYFMALAFVASTRSKDQETKHGAVIVNTRNVILGTGYNSFVKGINDAKMPATRPNKYPYMIHAEQNAIFNCSVLPVNCGGGKIYITGMPCNHCLQSLIQVGIKAIYIAKRRGTMLENEEDDKIKKQILSMSDVFILERDIDFSWVKDLGESLIKLKPAK